MPRGFSGMGDLVRQAQKMQQRLSEVQQGLKERVVEGTSGGNMVRVLVNGQQEIVAVKIDPSVVDPKDVTMLEDLVLAAARQGLKKAKDLANDEMGKVTGGVAMPGMF
ncbi:MAG TPA: YbaB/EbfC family nucleoid-associated protein [Planctomycetota bacterium]|nr:YbaB/EbfC family nucleoid-associated protein [Planctomycetota bacterium]